MVNRQLVADGFEVFPQQTVVVERADEIFYHLVLRLVQFLLADLLFQLVVERGCVAIDHLLVVSVPIVLRVERRGHFVVATDVLQRLFQRVLTLLALGLLLETLLFVGRPFLVVQSVVGRDRFQRRVVVDFHGDALLKLRQRHFQQLHLQHLLLRKPLLQFLLLPLGLYEFLCHDNRFFL